MRLYSHALLAIAVAACATAAAIVDAAFVRPWRVNDLGDLYTVGGLSWPLAQDRVAFWTQASAFEPLAYLETGPQRAKLGDRPFVLDTVRASSGLLTLLRARPVAGRTLVPSDYEPGSMPVALITSAFSTRAFELPEQAVGATLHILGIDRRIVGVTTAAATYRNPVDVWIPRTPEPPGARYPPAFRKDEWIGRLRSGISAAEAHEQLVGLQKQLVEQAAGTNIRFDGVIVVRQLLTDLLIRGGHVLTLASFGLIAIGLLVFSWIQVLRQHAHPHAADPHRRWITVVRHPVTHALPAIALGSVASWLWEQDAVAFWFRDLLPQSAGMVKLAVRGWSAFLTAAGVMLLGVAMLGCVRAVAALLGRPGAAISARVEGRRAV